MDGRNREEQIPVQEPIPYLGHRPRGGCIHSYSSSTRCRFRPQPQQIRRIDVAAVLDRVRLPLRAVACQAGQNRRHPRVWTVLLQQPGGAEAAATVAVLAQDLDHAQVRGDVAEWCVSARHRDPPSASKSDPIRSVFRRASQWDMRCGVGSLFKADDVPE